MWNCPNCGREHDCGDYPDHWQGASDQFSFDCECGMEFEVTVDWTPQFRALKGTVRASLVNVGDGVGVVLHKEG